MANRKKYYFSFMLLLLTCCAEPIVLDSTPEVIKTPTDVQSVMVTNENFTVVPADETLVSQVAVSPENTREIATPDDFTPSPTATEEASNTPIAPRVTPTSLSLAELIWSENVEAIATANGQQLVWSPVSNEFVVDSCTELPFLDLRPDVFIWLLMDSKDQSQVEKNKIAFSIDENQGWSSYAKHFELDR